MIYLQEGKKEEYPGKREGSQGFLFKQGMEDLIIKNFSQNQMIDWRIAKKILSVPNIFPEKKSQLLALIKKDAIFRAIKVSLQQSMLPIVSPSLLQLIILSPAKI